MAKVSVQIVTWNSKRYITECLDALLAQTYTDFSVIVIDNGSSDGTVQVVRSEYPTAVVLENFKNHGFAKANNQGIRLAKTEYILTMNADVIVEPDFLEKIMKFADEHPQSASFSGKVLKLRSEPIDHDDQSGLRESVKTNIIDTAGLQMYKSRRAVNRGENEQDDGQYDRAEKVFGVSAACALYRKSVLDEVAIKNEYFDEDFFSYKEDVDLAWRLQIYGYDSWYVPQAECYHHRGYSFTGTAPRKVVKHRREVSKFLRAMSFRNHHLMLLKNDTLRGIALSLPWFLFWEFKMVSYAVLFERFQLKSIGQIIKLFPAMMLKRSVIMAHARRSSSEVREWFK